VALVPESLRRLVEKGLEPWVEAGAGLPAGIADAAYEAAGAHIEGDVEKLLGSADLTAKVQPPELGEIERLREGSFLVAHLQPFAHLNAVRALAARRITSFSLDLMPRITRAQSMDVLSAMSTISGYKAALIAADNLPKVMPMLTTAAGTLRPARVLVIGAGVAGLQAIATARRLGAVVEGFDIRAATKQQVESLGARFVEDTEIEDAEGAGGYAKEQTAEQQERQRDLLSAHIAESDAVICTALVPGKRAPTLVSEDQVKRMRPGSVVVDLAAEQGGNCSLTRAGEVVEQHGVRVLGPVNLPADVPAHASQMFSRNVMTYLLHLVDDGRLELDLEDEITAETLVTRDGAIVNEAVRAAAES
jgi:NAD(P) transhydrogenase subunit alpha